MATRAGASPVRVWRTMLEIHADLVGELECRFREAHRLSVSEFDVLANIGPREAVRHGELAGRVILTRTALTRLLDRLAARGWLTRASAPDDQRVVLVQLTDEGRRLRREAARTNAAVVRAYFGHLTEHQVAALGDLTTALHHAAPRQGDTT